MEVRPLVIAGLLVAVGAAHAADGVGSAPRRVVGAAQPLGSAHTLRQIPEACARLEGMFTGDTAQPYRLNVVRTSASCQPRARFVDFDKAQASVAAGWTLTDVIRVPSAACPTQLAELQLWHKPAAAAAPRDGQGQSRIYLEDAKKQAAAGQIAQVPMYTAQFKLDGQACR